MKKKEVSGSGTNRAQAPGVSPISSMILSVAKCVKCSAAYGQCDCWDKKKYRRLRKGDLIEPTDEGLTDCGWEPVGFMFPHLPAKHQDTFRVRYDPVLMVPMRRIVTSERESAQAKPKPSQSHPQPRRPKK